MLDFDTAADLLLRAAAVPELMLLLKVTVLLALGLTAASMCRRAKAAARHLILVSTFAAVGALPLASAVMPQLSIPVPVNERIRETAQSFSRVAVRESVEGKAAARPVMAAATTRLSVLDALRLLWAAGTALLLAWLAVALVRLQQLRRNALPADHLSSVAQQLALEGGLRRSIHVLTHERVAAPLTCGLRHPTILLPDEAAEWNAGALQRALVHELEHVRRYDWATQLPARLVCVAFWFVPLVWIAWRQLRLEAERACDDAVVRSADSTDYAEQLVGLARRLNGAHSGLSLAMAGRSDLSRRVTSLLDGRQRRGRAGRSAIMMCLAASFVVLVSLAPIQAVEGGSAAYSLLDVISDDFAQGPWRWSRPDTSLYRAASRGDVNRMAELIDLGANVNEAISGDGSPLIGAARGGHLGAVQLLLERGADPNLAVEGDGNPLIMAAREGHTEIVKLLLDRGAYIDQVVRGDETALIQASAAGRINVVRLLLERKADPNVRVWAEGFPGRDGEWRTALSQARRGGHAAVVQLLVAAGARQ